MGQSAGAVASSPITHPAHQDSNEITVGWQDIGVGATSSSADPLQVTRLNGGYTADGFARPSSQRSAAGSTASGTHFAADHLTVTTPQGFTAAGHMHGPSGIEQHNHLSSAPASALRVDSSASSQPRRNDRYAGGERPKLSFSDKLESFSSEVDGYAESVASSSSGVIPPGPRGGSLGHWAAYNAGLPPVHEGNDLSSPSSWRQSPSAALDAESDLSGLGPCAYTLPDGDIDNTWDSVPSSYSSAHYGAHPAASSGGARASLATLGQAVPYQQQYVQPRESAADTAAAQEARAREGWHVGSVLEAFSATSGIWHIARVMQVRDGDDADVLTVKFYIEDGAKQKLLLRSDPHLAVLGSNTGGRLPPGFKIKPSQSRPGECVYFDATTGGKYGSLEMAWRTHFERLMSQPVDGIMTVKALPSANQFPAPPAAAVPDGPNKFLTLQEVQNLKQQPRHASQPFAPGQGGPKVALPQFAENSHTGPSAEACPVMMPAPCAGFSPVAVAIPPPYVNFPGGIPAAAPPPWAAPAPTGLNQQRPVPYPLAQGWKAG